MKIDPARNPLRRARLAARLELRDLEKRTRISPAMLRHIDEGDFHRLPAGIYARAWVRTFAEAVGLDPAETLRELEHALPKTSDGPHDKPPSPPGSDDAHRSGGEGGRDARHSVIEGLPSLIDRWRRSAGAILDGIFLACVSIAVWMLTAATAGVSPGSLGSAGSVAVVAITAGLGAAYFLLFAGVGGRTPGSALAGLPADEAPEPLDLAAIGHRALQAAIQESSILVEVMIRAEFAPTVEHRGGVRA